MIHRSLVRRHVPIRPSSVLRLLAAAGLGVLLITALPATTATQDPGQHTAEPRETPRFRAATNFVRVDVYAMQNGVPVRDLKPEDFEVLEDGIPQKIETFEYVQVRAPQLRNEGREPQTVREARALAEDPRSRVFVIFLDTYHTDEASSRLMRRPLTDFLNRVIGPDDLVGVMTPDMSARELSLGRQTETIENMLWKSAWGRRDELRYRDPEERMYEECFPERGVPRECLGITGKRTQSPDVYEGIAEEMINRRREKRALDALDDLVVHLGGIREERKAVLAVTDGWMLFRPNPNLTRMGLCENPPGPGRIGVGPDGKLTTDLGRARGHLSRNACEKDRQTLAALDNWETFRNLLHRANRANVSFYPVDARGLAATDTPIERNDFMKIPVDEDRARLRHRVSTLRTLAEETDGMAIVDSNDIVSGMRRIIDDVTSYYLIGYYSPNDKLDGKFRTIKVRVKRPAVDVRARRGYAPPTRDEIERGRQELAAAGAGAPPTAMQSALASLAGIRRDARLYTRVSWAVPGNVWITAELDPTTSRAVDWASGGTADVLMVADSTGDTIGSGRAKIDPGARVVSVGIQTELLQPGAYTLRLRVAPAAGGAPLTETASFGVSEGGADLGSSRLLRRRPTTGNRHVLTATPVFRRTEHLRVDVPVTGGIEATETDLLDRNGKPIQVPVTATALTEGGSSWASAEIALAPLAPGDYVVRTTVRIHNRRQEILTAFRVVP